MVFNDMMMKNIYSIPYPSKTESMVLPSGGNISTGGATAHLHTPLGEVCRGPASALDHGRHYAHPSLAVGLA